MKTFRVLFVTIQLLGAAYLAYLGTVTILSTLKKKSESESRQPEKGRKSFRQGFLNGFLCNILNPKAYIFFLSIFSQFMSSSTALWMEWVYAFEVVLVVGLWFCALSAVISSDVFKKGYRKAEKWIERFFGAVLVFFAVKIVKSAFFGD